MQKNYKICVIGAGLAGSECAYQLAKNEISTVLIEMRPNKMSPAHHTDKPAELVCSNSFRSNDRLNAVGLLKQEMQQLDSLVIKCAHKAKVPAGSALAVDRDVFSNHVADALHSFENLTHVQDEVLNICSSQNGVKIELQSGENLQADHCVIATGPLTSDVLAKWILDQTKQEYLYFYDSIAPIVDFESIDMSIAFKGSRYDKGEQEDGDYINCPMTQEQYEEFIHDIQNAELIEVKDFDKAQFFEGCLPIEEMVRRGPQTLQFGPLKPVGLTNPHHPDQKYAAVVQLRQDNLHASLYNMVGFQTRMKWGEQKRIFQKIPGLQNAEFVRMGSMHRNTYICSPVLLNDNFALKDFDKVHFAGQITGCEGYVESAAVGQFVGLNLVRFILQKDFLSLPPNTTALGALLHHILKADPKDYQPMNVNFGLFQNLEGRVPKKQKKQKYAERAENDLANWQKENSL